MLKRTLKLLPALLVLGLAGAPAHGADSNAASAEQETESASDTADHWGDSVVVTATRTERRLEESLASISVVNQEAIRRQLPRQLGELLRGRPGVDVVSNGPYGKVTGVQLRGTSGSQTLLLIDGIRMGSATSGGASWQYLPPRLLERVEILRGPRSSVYGADAIGGVVQAFTPEGEKGFSPWAELAGGSFNTLEGGAGFSGGSDSTRYSIGASHFDTDGIALKPGGERKGYDNTSFLGRVTHDFGGEVELGATGLRSSGRSDYIGGKTDFVHQAMGLSLEAPLGEHFDIRLSASESRDEADDVRTGGIASQFDTRRRSLRWENVARFGEHEFVLGVDRLEDRIESTTAYTETHRDNTALFAQATFGFGPASLELGGRHDDNSTYGSETTGSIAGGWRFDESHRLRISAGEGFHAPTFNQLYFPGFGNPDLEPERSSSIEAGFSGHYQRWYWDAVGYRSRIDNLIETIFADGVYLPRNVAEARIRGAELALGANLGPWDMSLALSYTDPENRQTGNQLRLRAREALRLEIDRHLGDWQLGATVVAQGARYNDANEQERLGGFGLLNLRAGWQFARSWHLRLTIDNALDKHYVTVRDSFSGFDYQQPGRNFLISLRYGE